MKKFAILFLLAACSVNFVFSQSITQKELSYLAGKIMTKLSAKSGVKRIIIDDFADGQGNVNLLGVSLSEDFSTEASNLAKTISIFDKGILTAKAPPPQAKGFLARTADALLKQTALNLQTSMLNATEPKKAENTKLYLDAINVVSVMNLFSKNDNRLKDIDAIVTGSITEFKSAYKLYIKVLDVKHNEVIAQDYAEITKTESLIELGASKPVRKGEIVLGGNNGGGAIEPFKKDNLTFEFSECYQSGKELEFVMEIKNEGNEEINLIIYNHNTRALNAENGNEYKVKLITMADVNNNYEVQKTLVPKASIKAKLTFTNEGAVAKQLSKIEIHCWTKQATEFIAELKDLTVR